MEEREVWPNYDIKPHINSNHKYTFKINYENFKFDKKSWSLQNACDAWTVLLYNCGDQDDLFNFPFRPLLKLIIDALPEKFGPIELDIPEFYEMEDFIFGKIRYQNTTVHFYYENCLAYVEFASQSKKDLKRFINASNGLIFSHPGYGF